MGATWSIVNLPDGSVRIELAGDIDLVAEAPLVEQVDVLATAGGMGEIHLDLAAVQFIDSSGIRALVRVRQDHGQRIRVVAASHPVRRVLDIAGLTEGFGLDGATDDGSGGEGSHDGGAEPTAEAGVTDGGVAG